MSEFLLESGFFGRLSRTIHRTKEWCGGGARLHGSADSIRIHWDENEWLASEAGHMHVFMPIVYLGSGIVRPQAPPLRTIYVEYRLRSTTLRRRSSCGVSSLSTGSDLWTNQLSADYPLRLHIPTGYSAWMVRKCMPMPPCIQPLWKRMFPLECISCDSHRSHQARFLLAPQRYQSGWPSVMRRRGFCRPASSVQNRTKDGTCMVCLQ